MLEQDDPPEEEGEDINHSQEEEEGCLNISESNDSIHELKKVTAIPILKNNDKFKSKLSKENQAPQDSAALSRHPNASKYSSIIPFSQRVHLNDPFQISF